MKRVFLIATMVSLLGSGSAWAFFESNKELISSAKISLADAVRAAVRTVPGKAAETEIGREDGRLVYWVEVVDNNAKTRIVYIDANTGEPLKIERD